MKHTALIIAIAAALTLGSCGAARKTAGDKTPATAALTDRPKHKKHNKSDVRESRLGVKPTQDELSGGRWTVASVGAVAINAEDETPYVEFSPAGRFYASDGCNIINGDYVLRSDGTMLFSNVISTMKSCPDIEYSALVAAQFADGTRVAVDCRRIGQDTYLYFRNQRGNVAMTLRRQNMEFLNGNWMVTAIEGKKNSDEELTIFIDIAELKIHGNTGCNFFNGEIYIDPARSNAIDFSNICLTRMACPKADRERRMVVSLEMTFSAIEGKHKNTVLLLDKKGKELLTLRRIPLGDRE